MYQIQTKYRDERRPRFGLVRAREFIMKDAYTFDVDHENMVKSYDNMAVAYNKAFDRMAMKYKVVIGDSGNMGGSISHEYIAITPSGESTIAYCDACDFAATDEVAPAIFDIEVSIQGDSSVNEKVHTPNVKTIEELERFFNCEASRFIKTLLYRSEDAKRVFAVMVPGHRTLNLVKFGKLAGISEDEIVMLSEDEIKTLAETVLGFVGPIGLSPNVELYADHRVFDIQNGICGANEADYHLKSVKLDKSICKGIDDLVSVEAGDACPHCQKPLSIDRGTEVGNIFQLGDKYSKAMNATFLDKDGKAKHFVMGSYGIGISRCVSAIVEQFHDEKGIVWPLAVAPYQVLITIVNVKNEFQVEKAFELYVELQKMGITVMIDDRNERAGVKFTDADLIGIPLRVTVGKGIEEGIVEFSKRVDCVKEEIEYNAIIEKLGMLVKNQLM